MDASNTFIFLMFIAILLVGFAQKIQIAYPIALVLGGSILGFIPGLTPIHFNPKILLTAILPPILFYGSYGLSFKEFIRYIFDISSLAIGLVIATTIMIAFLFKWLFPHYSWELAFAFGALISPPDAVATTMILKQFALSSRLKTILEGESLINDASSLVIYKFAVLALMTGIFSFKEATVYGIYAIIGGISLGLLLGYLLNQISTFLKPVVSVVFSFIIPYLTYVLADFLEMSGVLAVVTCGIVGARMLMTHFNSLTRILAWATWDIIMILLNCFIFTLIGLEFRLIIEKMSRDQILLYSGYGVLLTAAIIVLRFVWIYTRRGLKLFFERKDLAKIQKNKAYLMQSTISAWAGMRGIVSLTAALALPFTLPNGIPLEGREVIVFLTFEIILLTLVIPGLTLPLLIRKLGIQTTLSHQSLIEVRKKLTTFALNEIYLLYQSKTLEKEGAELLKMYFNSWQKITIISYESEENIVEKARHHILHKQKQYLMRLWINDEIEDEMMKRLEREIDLEESHLAKRDFI